MKLSLKNLFLFLFVYVAVILVSNFIARLVFNVIDWSVFPPAIGVYHSCLNLPFPTVGNCLTALPQDILFGLKVNYLGMFADILLLIFSFYLVFIKKVRLIVWGAIFSILCFLTVSYFLASEIQKGLVLHPGIANC